MSADLQPRDGLVGWRFATFEIDTRLAQVYRQAQRLEIERSGFDLLRCLVAHAPEVASKDALLAAGWPGRVVTENSLTKAISKLRRTLGDDRAELIVAVHGYGYRLVAEPQPLWQPAAAASPDPPAAGTQPDLPGTPDAPAVNPALAPSRRRAQALAWIGGALLLVLAVGLIWMQRRDSPGRTPRTTTGVTDEVLVAAVPFRDLSADGSLALLASGIADHLRADLHRTPGVRIVDRGPSLAHRDDGENAAQIAHALGADVIVGGDVRSAGGKLQVELRVTDARGTLPAQRLSFERAAPEQATLLDDLTLAMFKALSPDAGRMGVAPRRGGGTAVPEAYQTYLRAATSLVDNNDPNSQRRTIAILEHALALDPDYADAWLMLGGVLGGSGYYADTPEELAAGRVRALAAMDRGIALAPDDPWNYLLRSEMRLLYQFDWRGAQADIEAAKRLAPVNQSAAMTLIWQARFAASMNRLDDAVAIGSRAIALDPKAGGRRNQGWHYLALGDTRNARAVLQLQLADLPDSPHVHFYLALCDIFEGQPEAALRQLEFSSPMFRLVGTAVARHELGDRDASDRAIQTLADRYTPADGYWVATAHAWRGEGDAAFQWVEYAARAGDSSLMYLPFDPLWRKLRGDARLKPWLERLAPPPEVLAAFRARD